MKRWKTIQACLALAAVLLLLPHSPALAQGSPRPSMPLWMEWSEGAYLGVRPRDVQATDVARLKLAAERGALVQSVEPGSPAASAGIQADDVIVDYDGGAVQSVAQLTRMVGETPGGRTVGITVMRGGQRRPLSVKVGPMPSRQGGRAGGEFLQRLPDILRQRIPEGLGTGTRSQARLGLQLQPLTEQLADYFKVPGKAGVLVADVRRESPAENAGLAAGDVIVAVDGKQVREPGDLSAAVREARQGSVTIEYYRAGQKRSAKVDLKITGGSEGESEGGRLRL